MFCVAFGLAICVSKIFFHCAFYPAFSPLKHEIKKILIETEQSYFQSKNRVYQLVPGVKVVASIQIGQRTVANYLLSPFMGTMDQTFQER